MIVLFDLNGTLTDVGAIGAPWQRPDLGAPLLERAVHSAMVDALTGEYRPFADHVRAALEFEVDRRGLDRDRIGAALERVRALPAHPDAAEALDALRAAGHRLAVLTNSGADAGRSTLEAAGLAGRFEAILGVDAVETYKPDPRTYGHALTALDAPAAEVMLVAAHQWDVTGAKRAGLRTAWINRTGEPFSAVAAEPDIRAAGLADLARRVAAQR